MQVVKNPVLPQSALPHGTSFEERAIRLWGISGPNISWPFIPALPDGAFCLFTQKSEEAPVLLRHVELTNAPIKAQNYVQPCTLFCAKGAACSLLFWLALTGIPGARQKYHLISAWEDRLQHWILNIPSKKKKGQVLTVLLPTWFSL